MKYSAGILLLIFFLITSAAQAQVRSDSLQVLPATSYDMPSNRLSFDLSKVNREITYRSSWSYLGGFLENFSPGDPISRFQAGSIMDMRSYESRNWTEYQILTERMYFINYLNQKNGLRFYRN